MTTKKNGLASLVEGLPPTYWLIWIGTLINRLGGFVIPLLTLYLTTQHHIPVSQAALTVSLFGAGSFVSQLSGGELTDRLGRRPVMLMSFFITPIFMIALGLARDLILIPFLHSWWDSLPTFVDRQSARPSQMWCHPNRERAPTDITIGRSTWARPLRRSWLG